MIDSKEISRIFTVIAFLLTTGIASAAEQHPADVNAGTPYQEAGSHGTPNQGTPYAQGGAYNLPPQQYHSGNKPELIGIYVTPKIGYSSITASNTTNTYSVLGFNYSEPGGSGSTSAFAGGIAIGYDTWPQQTYDTVGFRTELEYLVRSSSKYSWNYDWGAGFVEKGDLKVNAHTLFINGYADLHTGTPFVPYLSAGVGIAFIQAELNEDLEFIGNNIISESGKKTTTNFAGNIGLGTAVEITENLALDINARYVMLGKGEASMERSGSSVKYEGDLSSFEGLAGIRISF